MFLIEKVEKDILKRLWDTINVAWLFYPKYLIMILVLYKNNILTE